MCRCAQGAFEEPQPLRNSSHGTPGTDLSQTNAREKSTDTYQHVMAVQRLYPVDEKVRMAHGPTFLPRGLPEPRLKRSNDDKDA